MKQYYDLIVACTIANRGIGFKNQIPWKISKDLRFFNSITTQSRSNQKNIIVMGKNTFQSIGRVLPNRYNIVISKNSVIKQTQSLKQARSVQESLKLSQQLNPQGKIFMIGGQKIFQETIENCRYLFETRINKQFECDRFMVQHNFPAAFISRTFRQNDITFDFCQYYNPKVIQKPTVEINFQKHAEFQYIDYLKKILQDGFDRSDRTGTGTKALFGNMLRYDLSQSFPLLTTKKIFWRAVVQQLLWFIKGSTDSNILKDKKIHIWDGNGSKEYLNSIGLSHRREGDLGPVYGFQWRNWGASYQTADQSYQGKGIDQLKNLINQIKKNPSSRRLILTAWNPSQLKQMALPPCHTMAQFFVSPDNKLSCVMYQRSCDMGLGVPFNIASYSLLTCMIAQVCGLQRGEFIHMLGDSHIYNDHIQKLTPELDRKPYPFPWLQLNQNIKDIDDFKFVDIKLSNYKSHGKISMKMAV